eukprot:1186964-Prorocentrum_minimum.AAC.1
MVTPTTGVRTGLVLYGASLQFPRRCRGLRPPHPDLPSTTVLQYYSTTESFYGKKVTGCKCHLKWRCSVGTPTCYIEFDESLYNAKYMWEYRLHRICTKVLHGIVDGKYSGERIPLSIEK